MNPHDVDDVSFLCRSLCVVQRSTGEFGVAVCNGVIRLPDVHHYSRELRVIRPEHASLITDYTDMWISSGTAHSPDTLMVCSMPAPLQHFPR